MNSPSADFPQPYAPRRARMRRPLWPAHRGGRALLAFPAVSAVFVVAVMLWSAGVFDRDYWTNVAPGELIGLLPFIAYNLLPPLLLSRLVVYAVDEPKARPVVAAGCVVFTGVLVWSLVDMVTSESSTAALLFLSLPIALCAVMIPFAVAAVVIRRRARADR